MRSGGYSGSGDDRGAQVGAHVEEVVLHVGQHRDHVVVEAAAGRARAPRWALASSTSAYACSRGVGLGGLAHVAEAGGAGVAGAGVDAGEVDHAAEPTCGTACRDRAEKVRHRCNQLGYNCVIVSAQRHSLASAGGRRQRGSRRWTSRTDGPVLVLTATSTCAAPWRCAPRSTSTSSGLDEDVVVDLSRGRHRRRHRAPGARRRHPPGRLDGHHLTVRSCGPAVRRMLHLTRLARVVEVERAAASA